MSVKFQLPDVVLHHSIELAPNTEYFVTAACNIESNESDYIFIPDNVHISSKGDIIAACALVRVTNKTLPVRLMTGDQSIYLQKGSKLGKLETLNKRGSYVEQCRTFSTGHEENVKITFDLSHLKNEDLCTVSNILTEYGDIFSTHKMDLGFSTNIKHEINTGLAPVRRKSG